LGDTSSRQDGACLEKALKRNGTKKTENRTVGGKENTASDPKGEERKRKHQQAYSIVGVKKFTGFHQAMYNQSVKTIKHKKQKTLA